MAVTRSPFPSDAARVDTILKTRAKEVEVEPGIGFTVTESRLTKRARASNFPHPHTGIIE